MNQYHRACGYDKRLKMGEYGWEIFHETSAMSQNEKGDQMSDDHGYG